MILFNLMLIGEAQPKRSKQLPKSLRKCLFVSSWQKCFIQLHDQETRNFKVWVPQFVVFLLCVCLVETRGPHWPCGYWAAMRM